MIFKLFSNKVNVHVQWNTTWKYTVYLKIRKELPIANNKTL